VLANRLSANPKYSVLVLEAGGDPNILNSIPGLASYNLYQKDTDWFYETIPTGNCGFGKENNVSEITFLCFLILTFHLQSSSI